jgi:hypothetical protein
MKKNVTIPLAIAGLLLTLQLSGASAADTPPSSSPSASKAAPPAIDVAKFTSDGQLLRPPGMENWVFVGTALGMGYNEAQFNPARPGLFQVVQMEPTAFRYFMANGHIAPGSMMLLSFYGADSRVSNNKTGYVQSALRGQEIHLFDPARKADSGHAFFGFEPDGNEGKPVPPGNECVRCHLEHGAFEGAFIQFYPAMRDRIPREALEKALADHDIR